MRISVHALLDTIDVSKQVCMLMSRQIKPMPNVNSSSTDKMHMCIQQDSCSSSVLYMFLKSASSGVHCQFHLDSWPHQAALVEMGGAYSCVSPLQHPDPAAVTHRP